MTRDFRFCPYATTEEAEEAEEQRTKELYGYIAAVFIVH